MTSSLTSALFGAAGSPPALMGRGARLADWADRGLRNVELVNALATGTPVSAVAILMFACRYWTRKNQATTVIVMDDADGVD